MNHVFILGPKHPGTNDTATPAHCIPCDAEHQPQLVVPIVEGARTRDKARAGVYDDLFMNLVTKWWV